VEETVTPFQAIIDQNLTTVLAYYRMYSTDNTWTGTMSIGPAAITPVALMSFEELLRALRNQLRRGNKDFLIGSHGNPSGFPYPVVPGAATTANADLLDDLGKVIAGDREKRRDVLRYRSSSNNALVFSSERQLDDFLGIVKEVRQLGIEHLEFRACNIGAGPALRAIHKFLGSQHTVAPKVYYIWSNIRTAGMHGSSEYMRRQVGRLPPLRRVFSRDDCYMATSDTASGTDPAFLMGASQNAQGKAENAVVYALSTDAVFGFSQAYLEDWVYFAVGQRPAGGGYRRGGNLPITGFWTPTSIDFPFVFAGDGPKYLEQLETETS
jgi:hypothetical protein